MHRSRMAPIAALLTLAAALPASAAEVEDLFPAESVLYFRYDGMREHGDAYERTTFARLMREDLGALADYVAGSIYSTLGPNVLSQRLLAGAPPDELIHLQQAIEQLPLIGDTVRRNGVAMAVEILGPGAPRFQITMVFPEGGREPVFGALESGLRLLGQGIPFEEIQRDGRSILSADLAESPVVPLPVPLPGAQDQRPRNMIALAAWAEGDHFVVTLSNVGLDHTLDLVHGTRAGLPKSDLYQRVAQFDRYETCARGFLDVRRLAEQLAGILPPATLFIDSLGLSNLEHLTFHVGFQDEFQRTTIAVEAPGDREGLLKLLAFPGEIDVARLPPLPPDAASVAVLRFDYGEIWDAGLDTLERIAGMFEPNAQEEIRSGLELLERELGFQIRRDLLDTLEPQLAAWYSPGDGFLFLGAGAAIPVKDPQRLQASIDRLIAVASEQSGGEVRVKSSDFHGARIQTLVIAPSEIPFRPSFTIHDGWLVFGLFPQIPQGVILRQTHPELSRWQPPATLQRALDEGRAAAGRDARLVGLSVADPRPPLRQVVSLAPLIIGFAQAQGQILTDFDLTLIPSVQALTEPLTESATIVHDDGDTIRIEGWSSLPAPFEMSGMELVLAVSLLGVF